MTTDESCSSLVTTLLGAYAPFEWSKSNPELGPETVFGLALARAYSFGLVGMGLSSPAGDGHAVEFRDADGVDPSVATDGIVELADLTFATDKEHSWQLSPFLAVSVLLDCLTRFGRPTLAGVVIQSAHVATGVGHPAGNANAPNWFEVLELGDATTAIDVTAKFDGQLPERDLALIADVYLQTILSVRHVLTASRLPSVTGSGPDIGLRLEIDAVEISFLTWLSWELTDVVRRLGVPAARVTASAKISEEVERHRLLESQGLFPD